jgi:polyphenol oxidase
MWQVHGSAVAYVAGPTTPATPAAASSSSPAPPVNPQVDATFTDRAGVALAVQVADCAPVLLADPVAGLVGAAHAGRPGMAAGVVPALVAAMTDRGADPSRMHAIIGPSICGRCYEVPAQLRDEVAAAVPGSACVTATGTPGIDLRSGLHRQLASAGLSEIADDARCTSESGELYSYRRDGRTGRFAGLIWLTA